MTRVFISYSSQDMDAVYEVQRALEKEGLIPYLAELDIRPGKPISRKIENAIKESDALVVILSESSLESQWVQQEIGFARRQIPVIPIRIGRVPLPAFLLGEEYIQYTPQNLDNLGDFVRRSIDEFEAIGENASLDDNYVCDEGPYEITPGSYVEISLLASSGNIVVGHIEEVTGDDFDWGIVDEINLVRYKNDDYRNLIWLIGSDEVSADRVRWKVPKNRKGPWYLLLEAPGKRNLRLVNVYLRKEK